MLGRALRLHRLAAAIVFALCLAGAAAYLALAPDRYEAEARLLVTPTSDPLLRSLRLVESPATVAELVSSVPVAERVAIRLRFDGPADAVAAVDAEQAGASDVVVVRGEAESPNRAAQVANAFADETTRRLSARFQSVVANELARVRERFDAAPVSERAALRERIARLESFQGVRDPIVELAGPAVAPRERVAPRPRLVLGVGAALGTVLALLVPLLLAWEPGGALGRTAGRSRRSRRSDIAELERLLARRGRRVPERRLELEAYLEELRARAPSGELSPGLRRLADDVFAVLR